MNNRVLAGLKKPVQGSVADSRNFGPGANNHVYTYYNRVLTCRFRTNLSRKLKWQRSQVTLDGSFFFFFSALFFSASSFSCRGVPGIVKLRSLHNLYKFNPLVNLVIHPL
jgi:hypothetical protein